MILMSFRECFSYTAGLRDWKKWYNNKCFVAIGTVNFHNLFYKWNLLYATGKRRSCIVAIEATEKQHKTNSTTTKRVFAYPLHNILGEGCE